MVNFEDMDRRLSECGHGASRAGTFDALRRGDIVVVIHRPANRPYVSGLRKEKFPTLAEMFPNVPQ